MSTKKIGIQTSFKSKPLGVQVQKISENIERNATLIPDLQHELSLAKNVAAKERLSKVLSDVLDEQQALKMRLQALTKNPKKKRYTRNDYMVLKKAFEENESSIKFYSDYIRTAMTDSVVVHARTLREHESEAKQLAKMLAACPQPLIRKKPKKKTRV